MNKVLLNFRQLERTKKEEQTVLWRVGTRRAFPVEERACWGQCSYKCNTGDVTKAEKMCLGFSLIVLGFFFPPTLGFLKPLFFPPVNPTTQQQSEQTGRKEDCSSETCVHTHRATTCLHHHGGLHPFWMELCRMGKEGRLVFFFFILCFFCSFLI